MLNQKKIEIFLTKIRKSLAKQFLEVAYTNFNCYIRIVEQKGCHVETICFQT